MSMTVRDAAAPRHPISSWSCGPFCPPPPERPIYVMYTTGARIAPADRSADVAEREVPALDIEPAPAVVSPAPRRAVVPAATEAAAVIGEGLNPHPTAAIPAVMVMILVVMAAAPAAVVVMAAAAMAVAGFRFTCGTRDPDPCGHGTRRQ